MLPRSCGWCRDGTKGVRGYYAVLCAYTKGPEPRAKRDPDLRELRV